MFQRDVQDAGFERAWNSIDEPMMKPLVTNQWPSPFKSMLPSVVYVL